MRIVITEFISLDGVVQAPGGPQEDTDGGFAHGGWSHAYFDPEVLGGAFDAALGRAEALLYGRRTWQTMAQAWPGQAGDPFADRINGLPKYVVSGTLGESDLTWNNSRLIPAGEALARLPVVSRAPPPRLPALTGWPRGGRCSRCPWPPSTCRPVGAGRR